MNRIPVKPGRPGLIVRDPHTKRALPDEGALVPENSFWQRRIRSRDVIRLSLKAWQAVESERKEKRRQAVSNRRKDAEARAERPDDTTPAPPENG